jgi:hypothetical protein
MSDYNRFTRICAFGNLRPELVQAIREYVHEQGLGGIEGEISMCCETTSERKQPGMLATLMGEDTIYYTAILFTPQRLIWARSGDKSGTQVFAANFKDVRVKAFDSKLVKDTGLEVFGYMGDPPRRMRGYIGLGPEEAARKFCEEIMKAEEKVVKAVPPKRRIKLGWW